MKVHFDEKTDAIYLRLDDSKIIESEEVSEGIILDFNEKNQVVGIEILGVKERIPQSSITEALRNSKKMFLTRVICQF